MDGIQQLGLLDDSAILLDEAALQIAAADHPGIDLGPTQAQIAAMAARLASLGQGVSSARQRARLLADAIAHGGAMTGDSADYDNPANADFLALFRRRRGLPVTLAILYVALARRIGWQADPVNLPGHVLVRVGGAIDATLIDPFAGGIEVDRIGLAALAARLGALPLSAEHLQPLGNRATLVRLVSNQASRARAAGDIERALVLYERMTLFAPTVTALWWERARLEQLLGQLGAARASLAAMIETTHDKAVLGRIRAAIAALARSNS